MLINVNNHEAAHGSLSFPSWDYKKGPEGGRRKREEEMSAKQSRLLCSAGFRKAASQHFLD